ncbi:MAG: TonB family protein, partial [Bacteroidota bacterium]
MSERTAFRRRYPLLLQVSLLLALALGVTAFSVPLRFGEDVATVVAEDEFVPAIEIEATEHRPDPPPPPKPPAPVEVPDADLVDDLPLDIDLKDIYADPPALPPPPQPPVMDDEYRDEPDDVFPIVEQQPELIGGLEGLQSRIQYPELARRAGIEGTVFVQFVVDEQGNVNDPVCVRD